DKKIGIGVISHCNTVVEPPEHVAALIRKALEYIPPERLVITTDCGFGREGLSRRIAYYKCVALVEGANIVRRELGLPQARGRAPRASGSRAETRVAPLLGRGNPADDVGDASASRSRLEHQRLGLLEVRAEQRRDGEAVGHEHEGAGATPTIHDRLELEEANP